MKIGILSRNPLLYSTSRLTEAAKERGHEVQVIDPLLRSNHGPVGMEVNSSPGMRGIETNTGKDVAGMVIEYIEKNAKPGKTKTQGHG